MNLRVVSAAIHHWSSKWVYAEPVHLLCQNEQIVRFELLLHIMLRDLLTQKCVHKKPVTDFRYTRACLDLKKRHFYFVLKCG
jgi:hypothetical protein